MFPGKSGDVWITLALPGPRGLGLVSLELGLVNVAGLTRSQRD